MTIAFEYGLKEKYLSLPKKDKETLYFCYDTRELFKGDECYNQNLIIIENVEALPSISLEPIGKIYYCLNTGAGYILNETKTGWQQIIYKTIDDITKVLEEHRKYVVPSVEAIINYVNTSDSSVVVEELKSDISNLQKLVGEKSVSTQIFEEVQKLNSPEISVQEDGSLTINQISFSKIVQTNEQLIFDAGSSNF